MSIKAEYEKCCLCRPLESYTHMNPLPEFDVLLTNIIHHSTLKLLFCNHSRYKFPSKDYREKQDTLPPGYKQTPQNVDGTKANLRQVFKNLHQCNNVFLM